MGGGTSKAYDDPRQFTVRASPKIGGTLLGIPMLRSIAFLGSILGALFMETCKMVFAGLPHRCDHKPEHCHAPGLFLQTCRKYVKKHFQTSRDALTC